jgi:cyclic pyranopterin phosphate synthase
MSIHGHLYRLLVPRLRNHPRLWNFAREVDQLPGLIRHTAAQYVPGVISPQPRQLTIAITSYCNLRCIGCRYGRDFMPNSELSLAMMRDMLYDAKELGFEIVRLYGGEPLLHRDLPRMVEYAVTLGLRVYVTTNGILLKERVDDLYAAGLRQITIGFYGVGADYNAYVQRREQFARLEESVAYVRRQYGKRLRLALNWLLMRPSCNVDALHHAFRFAQEYDIPMGVDLIHYSLPYFSEGPDRELQFRPEDRPQIERVLNELIHLKQRRPDLIDNDVVAIRSFPDWLLRGPEMRVPCDAYQMVWVGADGTVQMCYVTFKLGNLHEKRLRDMMFTDTHRQAARDAYALNCPNCHCHSSYRIKMHLPSRLMYLKRHSFEESAPAADHAPV